MGNETVEASPQRDDACADGDGEPRHLPVKQRAMRLTWAWFSCTMSTGALASLLGQQPFSFPGLNVIGRVVFIIDIVLFCLFSSLICLRFLRTPRALASSLHQPDECFFFGAFWVSLALILYGMSAYGIPGLGGSSAWLVSALRVLFWAYFACAMLLAVIQCAAVPAWVLPSYPFLVAGPLAAQIAKSQPDESAVQIIVAGIAGQGLGWILALLIYNLYFMRLAKSDLPGPSERPDTCAGLIALGQQGRHQLPNVYLGLSSIDARDVWYAVSVPAGLFLWMVALWFAGLTTLSVIRGVKQMRFVLQWWAFVFPNAGLAIATIKLGTALDSNGLKAFASGLTVILCLLWLLCAGTHIWSIWHHGILCPGKDPGIDDGPSTNASWSSRHPKRDV
ncbi:voltage-dependent anion channel [Xylariaceae sp. FL0016]|nr:voltage-dependent anion channel [Xylariaceae sp. FL0016]